MFFRSPNGDFVILQLPFQTAFHGCHHMFTYQYLIGFKRPTNAKLSTADQATAQGLSLFVNKGSVLTNKNIS